MANLANFLLSQRDWFRSGAVKLLLCQAASLLISLGQLLAMDFFLRGNFLNLGIYFSDFPKLLTALETVFPLVVICSMQFFGPSGTLVKTSGICVLPINILNEKIYLFLLLWFLALVVVSLFQLARQAALLVPDYALRAFLCPGIVSSLPSPRQVTFLSTCTITCCSR